ncbi:TetR/AcrR family transcriptional regulator [Agromyces sp. SYSU K20354]|uniref:TetR/AcrR family transcriptional regulator n=1 Tax=Agromyces cavernae TaxID=2898659 RepID=UPI001E503777|nr:TetR/AcrR family transcriptional regulator [Agromyces cavernae]MCD2442848.1 TetR/AcrR family transcriptional regulator [Agromyces cavernae]
MAQPSNRGKLLEATLRCFDRFPLDKITVRAIAAEAGANPASVIYHFGSRDALLSAAAVEGLDRWLAELAAGLTTELDSVPGDDPGARLTRAAAMVTATRSARTPLTRAYTAAVAMSLHDDNVRHTLAEGFRRARPALAAVLGLGDDDAGQDAAGLLLAMFHGMLVQTLLDDDLAIDGARLDAGLRRVNAAAGATA